MTQGYPTVTPAKEPVKESRGHGDIGCAGHRACFETRPSGALRNVFILRKPPLRDAACGGSSGQGGCLEGRTALIQRIINSFTTVNAGIQSVLQGVGSGFPLSRERRAAR